MPSRRQFVAAAGSALAALAGCVDGETDPVTAVPTTDRTVRSATETAAEPPETDRPTDTEAPTEDSLAEWSPAWTLETEFGHVLALTRDGTDLYATLSDDGSRSAIAAVDYAAERLRWRTAFEGDAVVTSFLEQGNARDKWGVGVRDGTLYVVTGNTDDYAWTALHALDPATGERRWSFRRERELTVAGVIGDTVVAGGREFFVPESTHDTPEEPLPTAVYGLDAASGSVRWTREFRGVTAGGTAASRVVVGEGDRVTGLDAEGHTLWSASTTDPRAVLAVGDGVVVAAADGEGSTLRAFGSDGKERWRDTRPVEEFLAVGDRLYALGDETVAYDADGDVRWQVDGYSQWPLLAPDGETLYARAAVRANAVDAFSIPGSGRRFRYETPSNNGWPAGATDEMVVAEAITPDLADFTSLYAVDGESGSPMAVYRPTDAVFDVAGVDETAYAAIGDRVVAFERPE
ncbi:PQQ-binding-like beta-propeller repeat protein [Haloarcula marina]|uniref:outer membrane protein assembly factor BamB family protein n=1 Tax=Haloarcula marina TaxID=2961574 RepID=UPI0020B69749|nr:PQQ-binding-like beta-propeller repeat protein [Halomicroarcula marina]